MPAIYMKMGIIINKKKEKKSDAYAALELPLKKMKVQITMINNQDFLTF